jgi:hypothetical protein
MTLRSEGPPRRGSRSPRTARAVAAPPACAQVLEENCGHFAVLLAPEGAHPKDKIDE